MSDLWALSAAELLGGYRRGDFTPAEVIDAIGARIERLNPKLGAFTTQCLDRARDEAAAVRPGDPRALAGVPFAAKDLFDSDGVRTTYGSAMFAGHVPSSDAAAVATLRAAGAILVGKTQTHEFAWGITCVNEAMGSARNPWDPERIAGGSSGGSAAALAARMVPLAIGTDTGGSVRIPAAFCGVMGLKPTYGRISLDGVWPLAPSLDHAGPMARTPADLELLFAALGGGFQPRLASLDGVRVRIGPDVPEPVVATLGDLGARVEPGAQPWDQAAFAIFSLIQAVEAAAAHRAAGLYPDRLDEYGADVRSRLERAARVDPAAYVEATAARETLRAEFVDLLQGDALLVTPVAAVPPPRPEDTATLRDAVMPHTTPQNLAGLPACAVRTGFDEHGLPVGVQITGAAGRDGAVLSAARALHEATRDGVQSRWPG